MKVIAVDFDGTLAKNRYPNIGEPNIKLINHLIKRKAYGDKLILWTCRIDKELDDAIEWCKEHGLEFDTVNDNLPEIIEAWDSNPRKIFADIYLDDRNNFVNW